MRDDVGYEPKPFTAEGGVKRKLVGSRAEVRKMLAQSIVRDRAHLATLVASMEAAQEVYSRIEQLIREGKNVPLEYLSNLSRDIHESMDSMTIFGMNSAGIITATANLEGLLGPILDTPDTAV